MRKSTLLALASMGLVAALSAGPAPAQSLLMRDIPSEETRFDLRWMHPVFKNDARLHTLSGDYDFSFDTPVGAHANFAVRLPMPRFRFAEDQTESGFGNVYLGIQTRPDPQAERAFSFALGVYAPTSDRDKPELGTNAWIANPYEIEKTITDDLILRAEVAQRYYLSRGAFVGWEYATSMLFPVHKTRSAIFTPDLPAGASRGLPTEDARSNVGVHLHGGICGGLRGERAVALAELVTEYWATAGSASDNRFYPAFAVGAGYLGRWARPSVFYMLQLDGVLKDLTSGSLGLKIELLPFGAES